MRCRLSVSYILAFFLLNQALSGNEGKRWMQSSVDDLQKASEENDPYAQGYLALAYAHGDKGLNVSMSNALEFARLSSKRDHWLGHFALGYLARFKPYGPDPSLVKKHYLRSFQDPDAKMIKAYANKDPIASYALAEIFTSDEVRPVLIPDLKFASKHYELSSENGYSPATVELALFRQNALVEGEGADREDLADGMELLKKAAEKKLPSAFHFLGRSYVKGIGVEMDFDMALVNFRAAADRGYSLSQVAVADLYAYGVAGPPKLDLALRYARLALDQNEKIALEKIAEYEGLQEETAPMTADTLETSTESTPPAPMTDFSSSSSVPVSDKPIPDQTQATRLPSIYDPANANTPASSSSRQNSISSASFDSSQKSLPSTTPEIPLGDVRKLREQAKDHYWGRGTVVDLKMAHQLFRQSSDLGDGEAARYLGIMNLSGKGVPQDRQKALLFLKLASDRGDELASKNLLTLNQAFNKR